MVIAQRLHGEQLCVAAQECSANSRRHRGLQSFKRCLCLLDFENENFSWLNQKAIDGGLASHVKIRLCHLQQTLGMLPLFTPTCFKHCEGIRILPEGSDSCLLQGLSLDIQDDILY